jgi:hypothetical protein
MKYAIVALLLFSQIACTTDTNSYTLSGSADGLEDGSKVIIYSLKDNRTNVIDTLLIKNGSFSGKFPKITEPSMYFMVISNSSIPYFPESEDLKATIYKDSIQASFVTGNLQNDSYREFAINSRKVTKLRTEISDSYRAAKRGNDDDLVKKLQQQNVMVTNNEVAFKKNFAKENPNSIFALLLVSEMLNQKQLNAREASDLVANFSPKIGSTDIAKEITATAQNLKNSDVGGQAPAFTAQTPEGGNLSLKDAMGEYTIIDF